MPSPARTDHVRLPDRAALKDAALAYLARFAATELTLKRMLDRKIDRALRRLSVRTAEDEQDALREKAAGLKRMVPDIVREMAGLNAVSDEAFAQGRTRSLRRSGHSLRAVQAHLAQRGVASEMIDEAMDSLAVRIGEDTDTELAAALIFARKRRAGPFAAKEQDETRTLAAFARAGFSQDIARQALGMDPDEAEEMILNFRSGGW
ncbi:RecX family transcriptional regulator [Acetobacter sp. AN02]|uniref:regulatory protein RecX n=1 Tax=Acetobacter sp. AN02 TaxID=2894186 RepID=UPI0024340D4E|nr:RecX family transcriptional regulator [Acetobacter sp. AN02]MDG6094826.1 RecX family transcriptional regulator [Acetobacter sp. AN02]